MQAISSSIRRRPFVAIFARSQPISARSYVSPLPIASLPLCWCPRFRELMLIPFILCFFLLRDFLLLKMGPPSKVLARLRVYAGVLLVSELLFSVATSPLTTERFLQLARSPRVILPLALFY